MADGRFAGRVALVTGGTSGIGKATVLAFAREGAAVGFTGRRSKLGASVVTDVEVFGGRALYIETDHTRPDDCQRAVGDTVAHFGHLDILVNNAGVIPLGTAEDTTEEEWARILAVNVTAVWRMSVLAVPHLRAAGGGAIVNNASHWGLVGAERAAAYCASKGAVVQLTRAMALDHGRDGIRVNAVCPGDVMTEVRRESGDLTWMTDGNLAAGMRKAGEYLPIGRIASTDEVAAAILFLAADDSSYVTGAMLAVDGGHTAR